MKIRYLGTAAAEGIPALFCNCKVCLNALEKRGKEVKTRSQALIDDKLLIDFPPDTYLHVLNYGLDLRKIHHCIITHHHSDHLYVNEFWCRLKGIANDIEEKPMHIYVTQAGYEELVKKYGDDNPRLSFHKLTPFAPFAVEEYRIIPLAANHDPKADPVIYIIEKGNQSLLYAHDTGIFPDATFSYLRDYGKSFDFVSLDCTVMAAKGSRHGHLGLDTDKELCQTLSGMGLLRDDTILCVNHFSHNGMLTHEQLVAEAEKEGFMASYDGLEISF